MKRQIIYPGAVPLETDLLNTNKNMMIGLAKLAAGILGTATFVNGLACTPTGPASLQVNVAPGEIYSLQNIDGTAYSSLAADTTHSILKQGISLDQLTLSCPAPVTVGQSVNYLIQATYQDVDSGSTVLPYYNASNPSTAYSGPANSGTAQNTTRDGVCTVSAKAGIAATTGTQTTPAPDAGYIGLFVVTVANGQTQITSTSISTYAGAPFMPNGGFLIGGLQNNLCNSSVAGGTADAITAAYFPGITALPAAGAGVLTLYLRAASANATTTPTFTPNSGVITAKQIVKGAGSALAAGDIAGGGHWIELQYDATLDKWVLLNPATGITSASVASVQGAVKNLQASATGTNATVSVSADEIAVEDSSNTYKTLRTVSLSVNSAATGANGLDTGSLATSTWYSLWVIYNPTTTTTAGLLSLSATAPTMPSGYTMKARVGWIRTDGTANKYPLSFKQFGRRVQYVVVAASNVLNSPIMASGTAGSLATPTWVAVSVSNFIPPTASKISIGANSGGGGVGGVMVASNNLKGAYSSNTNPPDLMSRTGAGGYTGLSTIDMIVESSNVYWAADITSALFCSGWEDNL